MATERLYYNDCYGAVFDATVVNISGGGRQVRLDKTLFYPPSGGQPRDAGSLNGLEVIDVTDEEGGLTHVLAQPLPPDVTTVHGEIDWPRRYDHMQQHTGQHLLSAVFAEMLGYPTLSFNMGAEISTIELGTPVLSEHDLARVEARANELAWAALPVSISYENATAAAGLRKASEREGTLRIIEIAGIDRSACGGTHVRTTAELAPIQVRGSEKVRGNLRVEFVCGGRALARSKADYRLLTATARELGCPFPAVPDSVVRLRGRVAEAEKEGKRLNAESAHWQAASLYRETAASQSGIRFLSVPATVIDDRARNLAAAFTALGQSAMAVWSEETRSVLLAVSPDSGLHAGNILKALLTKYGGKGGGSASVAQGSVPAETVSNLFLGDLEASAGRDSGSLEAHKPPGAAPDKRGTQRTWPRQASLLCASSSEVPCQRTTENAAGK